jgi:hypothetical protein
MVKAATIHLILSIAISNGWSLRHLDVQNVFLHDVLEEEVFMKQPPSCEDKHAPHLMCKLDKGLYGLKQALRAYSKLSSMLQLLGFVPSKGDTSLFFYYSSHVTMSILVYVDDIIVASSSPAATDFLLRYLAKEFAPKDLGALCYFFGIEVTTLADGILLSLGKYATELLHNAGIFSCKPVHTPISTSEKLSAHAGDILGPQDATSF